MPGVPGANSQNVTIGPGGPAGPGDAFGLYGGYPQVPSLPRVPDSGPGQALPRDGNGNPGNLIDPQRAANMMSPVGQHYPEHVDWGAAAAARARAVPPWLLVVLFVAALGIALALTIVIAKLLR
jgi:hypothetical protein